MVRFLGSHHATHAIREAERTTDRAASEGDHYRLLRIRLAGPTLSYLSLDSALTRTAGELRADPCTGITVDFADVDRIEAPWTPVIALLVSFAYQAPAPCQLSGLHGQPATIVDVLAAGGFLGGLFRACEPASTAGGSTVHNGGWTGRTVGRQSRSQPSRSQRAGRSWDFDAKVGHARRSVRERFGGSGQKHKENCNERLTCD